MRGDWQAITRNKKNRWVFHLPPTAIGYTKLWGYFSEMGNCDLEVSAAQADFGIISEVKKVPVPMKERGNNRMCDIGSAVANLEDTFVRYSAEAANMFPGGERKDNRKMSMGLGDIAKLNARE